MANIVSIHKQRPPLSSGGEDCLEAALVLGRAGYPVRVTALARRLGVSKPTVVAALAALERRGLVRHERYGGVELTAAGRRQATETDRRHRLVRTFLARVLGVNDDVAEQDACRIEHNLSPETVSRLVAFVRRRRA